MLKDVKETAVWERKKGEFSVIGVPAVIISVETFLHLQKDAEKILGTDGAAVLFYESGKNAGERWINRFRKDWGLKEQKCCSLSFPEGIQRRAG